MRPRHRDLPAAVRRRQAAAIAVLVVAAAVALVLAVGGGGERPRVPLQRLVGQTIVGRMGASGPSAELLRRVREGRLGGVVAFPESAAGLRRQALRLRSAARAGGAPPPLIAIDQEGGPVRRLPGPPLRSPRELGEMQSTAAAEREGRRTGDYLSRLGVTVDLAPVLDVPGAGNPRSLSSRAFSTEPGQVAALGAAWARGLGDAGVAPVGKHFPGLGLATANTDFAPVRVAAPREQLEPGLEPFAAAVDAGIPMMMVSTAIYPAFDGSHPAALSAAVVSELRDGLGFEGVIATDDLEGEAVRGVTPPAAGAVAALGAGVDLVLLARTARASARAYDRILAAARAGSIERGPLDEAYARILALKGAGKR